MNKTEHELRKLDDDDGKIAWDILVAGKPAGIVRLDMDDEYVEAPSLYCAVDDKYGSIKNAVMKETLSYAYRSLPYESVHSRYLITDNEDAKLYKSLGFEPDGKQYKDDDGMEWQNVRVKL